MQEIAGLNSPVVLAPDNTGFSMISRSVPRIFNEYANDPLPLLRHPAT